MSDYRDPACSVFVGNIESSVEEPSIVEEVLWELFLQAGPLKSVHLPKIKDTGIPKKFAFVEFENEISVPYACQLLSGINLFGRTIQVKPSSQGVDNTPIRTIYNSPVQSPGNASPQGYSFENAPNTYDPQQQFGPKQGFDFSHASPPSFFNSPHGPPRNWTNQRFQTPPVGFNQGGWGNTSPVHLQAMMNNQAILNNVYSARHGNGNHTPSRTPPSSGRRKRY